MLSGSQPSTREPPQAQAMTPTGTCSARCNIVAKNQPVALNHGAVSAEATCHLPGTSSTISVLPFCGMGAMRT